MIHQTKYYTFFLNTLLILCLLLPALAYSQNKQKIEIVIDSFSGNEDELFFAAGEKLRRKMQFSLATEEYRKVIENQEISGKEAEAHYNIGLCYTWLQEMEKASNSFNEVIKMYPDNAIATAFAEYGLAWVEIQNGKYYNAINRLQRELDEKSCPDYEFNAMIQFQIGKIYLKYLQDFDKAEAIFQRVRIDYPKANILNHPYLDNVKKQ